MYQDKKQQNMEQRIRTRIDEDKKRTTTYGTTHKNKNIRRQKENNEI